MMLKRKMLDKLRSLKQELRGTQAPLPRGRGVARAPWPQKTAAGKPAAVTLYRFPGLDNRWQPLGLQLVVVAALNLRVLDIVFVRFIDG